MIYRTCKWTCAVVWRCGHIFSVCLCPDQASSHVTQTFSLKYSVICSDRAWRSWPGRRVTRRAQNSSHPLLTQQSTPGGPCHSVTVLLRHQSNRLHRHTDKTRHVVDPRPGTVTQPLQCFGIRVTTCADVQTGLVVYLTPRLMQVKATTCCQFALHRMVAIG